VKTYPTGYTPDTGATMTGLKVYRNVGTGLFMHITRNIDIVSSLFLDNRLGIDIDRANNIRITSTAVVGKSDMQQQYDFQTQNEISKCSSKKVIGIEIHSWKDDESITGASFNEVVFSGFQNVPCTNSVPISIDDTVSACMNKKSL
jgi:hypothetical protein